MNNSITNYHPINNYSHELSYINHSIDYCLNGNRLINDGLGRYQVIEKPPGYILGEMLLSGFNSLRSVASSISSLFYTNDDEIYKALGKVNNEPIFIKTLKIKEITQRNSLLESLTQLSNSAFHYLEAGRNQLSDLYEFGPSKDEIGISLLRVLVLDRIIAGALRWTSLLENSEFWVEAPISYIPHVVALTFGLTQEFYPKNSLYQLRKLAKDQTKKDVVFICLAKSDLNGAIYRSFHDNIETFKKLSSTHSIVLKKVDLLEDINQEIDQITDAGREIFATFLMGHGLPNEILFGTDSLVSELKDEREGSWLESNKKWIGRIHFSKLKKNGHIVHDSCSNGELLPYPQLNIAERAQYHSGPTIKVHASDRPHSGISFDSEFNVRFIDAKKTKISYEEVVKKYQDWEKNQSLKSL